MITSRRLLGALLVLTSVPVEAPGEVGPAGGTQINCEALADDGGAPGGADREPLPPWAQPGLLHQRNVFSHSGFC